MPLAPGLWRGALEVDSIVSPDCSEPCFREPGYYSRKSGMEYSGLQSADILIDLMPDSKSKKVSPALALTVAVYL